MNGTPIKAKKGEKAYILIPEHIKKSSKDLAAKRKITLSELVARLIDRK
jgi:hypothetical protein